jgi:hypothetical protein
MGFMLSGLLYGLALCSYNYWWACICMWMCLGREVRVKVDVTNRCTRSYCGTDYRCLGYYEPLSSCS